MGFFDPQTMTSGGYGMEAVCWLFAAIMVLDRLLRALFKARCWTTIKQVFRTRAAYFAMSFAGLLLMGLKNRAEWWYKHAFTDRAYVTTDYNIFFNSVVTVTLLYCCIAFLNGRTDKTLGVKNSYWLFVIGAGAFFGSSFLYVSIH